MNIFILDKDPIIAAQMLCDKHVIKMPLETAQLLCSVFWVSLNNQMSLSQIPYKLTHILVQYGADNHKQTLAG